MNSQKGISHAAYSMVFFVFVTQGIAANSAAAQSTEPGPISLNEVYEDQPERMALLKVIKDGYILFTVKTKLHAASPGYSVAGAASEVKLSCKSGIGASKMSFALGMSVKLGAQIVTPAAKNAADLLSGAIAAEPIIPLAYVVDLDGDDPKKCDWDHHNRLSLGAARISDIGSEIDVKLQRASSQSSDVKFIGIFIEAAKSFLPFNDAAKLAKKLILDEAEQKAAKELMDLFTKLSTTGSLAKQADSWNWRKQAGRRFVSHYVRSFTFDDPDRKAFVVSFLAEPVASLFDAAAEVKENRVVRKYDFASDPMATPLGQATTAQHTIRKFVETDTAAKKLFDLLKRNDTPASLFRDTCAELKGSLQNTFGFIDDDTAFVLHAVLNQTRWKTDPAMRSAGCPDDALVKTINRLLVQGGEDPIALPNEGGEKDHDLGELIDQIAAVGKVNPEQARVLGYGDLLDENVAMTDGDKLFTETGQTSGKEETQKALAKRHIDRMGCHTAGKDKVEASIFGVLDGDQAKKFEANIKAIVTFIPDKKPQARLYKVTIKELKKDDATKTRLNQIRSSESAACKKFVEQELKDLI